MRHDIINQLTIAMLHDISCTNQHALFTFYFSNHNSVFFMVSVSSTQCCKLYFSKNPEIKITVTVHRRSITTSCIHVSNISHSLRDWRPFVPDVRLMNSSKLTSGFDFESCGHLCIALLHLTIKFINILIIAVWKLWPLQLLMDYMQFFFCLVSEDGDTLVSLLHQLNGRPVTDIILCCVAGWAAAVHWLCHLCETLTKISVLHGIQGRYCTTGTFVVVQHYVDWQLDLLDGCSGDIGCEAAVRVHSYSKTASLTYILLHTHACTAPCDQGWPI